MGVNSDLEELASNTEYSATKCRITKPPPPKPATNPLQFVKVGPSPLYKKAQEQIKAVEEVKVPRQEVREDAEDWQHNLDNWKSSRRKRQEHIIERVEEVKKLEQEENERRRRKSTTFHEMVERRSRGRPKFNYPIYDEDANDLSDYGIGSSSSKTNSIKDVDTDDSSSVLDDNLGDSACNKYNSSASNQSQSEDELCVKQKETYSTKNLLPNKIEADSFKNESKCPNDSEQYTYEGAIQDYRSRIRTKININESIFNKPLDSNKSKEFSEAQILLPKGNLFKRRELFDKGSVEVNSFESSTSRKLSEEFQNTQSIKERLERLEKCVDQPVKVDKSELPTVPVKTRLQNLNKQIDNNVSNNNNNKNKMFDESGNTEDNLYMDKLNTTNGDLDDFIPHYPASASSTDLMTLSSDREDSGIHTSDISCSISQSDEAFDDTDLPVNTIPTCIEKLNKQDVIDEKPKTIVDTNISKSEHEESALNLLQNDCSDKLDGVEDEDVRPPLPETLPEFTSLKEVVLKTDYPEILKNNNSPELPMTDNLIKTLPNIEENTSETNQVYQVEKEEVHSTLVENIEKTIQEQDNINDRQDNIINDKIVIYENVEFPNYQSYPKYIDDIFEKPIEPPKLQPPTEKPPPPPPSEIEDEIILRQNSAKSIKKELDIKRSSFLGLDEPTPDVTEENIFIRKPPDVNTFLQNESRLEKSIYKQLQGSLNSINNPNLDFEPGKDKLQNWLSTRSLNLKSTSEHPTDEDEITKKEREIIELVEKEEKSRDYEYPNPDRTTFSTCTDHLGSEKFDNPYFPETLYNKIDEQDSEVLKVEHELLQLEREELERQRESLSFRKKNNIKLRQNHHSYENIYDVDVEDGFEYRKSMPELQQPPLDFNKPLPITSKPIADDIQYRKSMPDIQRSYNRSVTEYPAPQRRYDMRKFTDHRKSMPDLQPEKSAFMPPAHIPPIMPGKPLKPLTKEQKEKFMILNSPEYDNLHANRSRPYNRHTLHALGAPPRPKNLTNDNWIQPKNNPEVKSYNQHWLFQEAELRRISEQKSVPAENRNMHEKRATDPVLQSYSQKVYKGFIERNPPIQMPELCNQKEYTQHPYLGHMQTLGHAQPIPFSPPSTGLEEGQDIMLSVSGKKKCSYCGNELGRGAAMIIESLCLFYHMECFKCCVCHMQLGDGLMGTDVRVRNQKLHCQNCYSSDDGIKFSCV